MSKMPDTLWVGEHGKSKMASYDIVCVHTIVGYAPAHAAHFSTDANGTIYQSRDTVYQSAANLEGNPRCIAIENADMPPTWATNDGHAVPDFTAGQVEAIARIIVWCHETHGIPIAPCPDSKPGSRGVAYHRQGIDGNWASYAYGGRVSGGEEWSTSGGKVCPGDRRITTLLTEIIPRALELTDEGDWFDMATKDELAAVVRSELNKGTGQGQPDWAGTSKATLGTVQGHTNDLNSIKSGVGRIEDKLDGGGWTAPVVAFLIAALVLGVLVGLAVGLGIE